MTSSDGLSKEEQAIRLFHDLPLTREEYICSFLLESEAAFSRKDSVVELANRADDAASECQLDILKVLPFPHSLFLKMKFQLQAFFV